MGRKSRGELLSAILDELENGPFTANEIADSIGSNWDTVKNNLEVLEEIGMVKGVTEGKKKTTYHRVNANITGDSRTWFKLPISAEDITKTELMFASAREAWKKWAHKQPTDVQLEKTVFELIASDKKWDIPMGWYLYGPMAQMRIDSMNFTATDAEVIAAAKPIVDEQKKFKYSTSLILHIYKKYNHRAHYFKIQFEEQLKRGIQTDEQKADTIIYLNSIMRDFTTEIKVFEKSMRPAREHLDAFISIVSKLILAKGYDEINNDLREPIRESFLQLWKFMSRIRYFEDLSEYLEEPVLKAHFNRNFLESLQDVEISLDVLLGLLPQEKVEPHPKFAKFVGAAKD